MLAGQTRLGVRTEAELRHTVLLTLKSIARFPSKRSANFSSVSRKSALENMN